MNQSTSIKVPRQLRDRIAERARLDRTTMATAIERAFDAAEEKAFWRQVAANNASIPESQRDQIGDGGALFDDLANATDDKLSATDAW